MRFFYLFILLILCLTTGFVSGIPFLDESLVVPLTAATCVCLVGTALCCTEVVTTGNTVLVERLGKYHRSLQPGWHWLLRPLEAVSFRGTTREQILDVPPQQCYTKDNAPLKADAVVFLRIFDVHKARYEVNDFYLALHNLVLTQIREQVGKLTLDESFSSRDRINQALLSDLNAAASAWGVEITRVEIQNLQPSPDILSAMETQMSAERKRRAAVLQSEGERATLVNTAEGKALAALEAAKAKKTSIELLAKAYAEKSLIEAQGLRQAIDELKAATGSTDAALQMLLFREYMNSQSKFAESNNTKAFLFPTKDSLPVTYKALSHLLK